MDLNNFITFWFLRAKWLGWRPYILIHAHIEPWTQMSGAKNPWLRSRDMICLRTVLAQTVVSKLARSLRELCCHRFRGLRFSFNSKPVASLRQTCLRGPARTLHQTMTRKCLRILLGSSWCFLTSLTWIKTLRVVANPPSSAVDASTLVTVKHCNVHRCYNPCEICINTICNHMY